jgi:hypothetical protein
MLYTQLAEAVELLDDAVPICPTCTVRPVEIHMLGYACNDADILLCGYCAQQLARKLLEDLCDLAGDRHG